MVETDSAEPSTETCATFGGLHRLVWYLLYSEAQKKLSKFLLCLVFYPSQALNKRGIPCNIPAF